MAQANWITGIVLLSLVGCSAGTFTGGVLTKTTVQEKDQVVQAKMEVVGVALEGALKKSGYEVTTRADSTRGIVVLESGNKRGERFRLTLSKNPTRTGDATTIQIEWLETRDPLASAVLLGLIQETAFILAQQK